MLEQQACAAVPCPDLSEKRREERKRRGVQVEKALLWLEAGSRDRDGWDWSGVQCWRRKRLRMQRRRDRQRYQGRNGNGKWGAEEWRRRISYAARLRDSNPIHPGHRRPPCLVALAWLALINSPAPQAKQAPQMAKSPSASD